MLNYVDNVAVCTDLSGKSPRQGSVYKVLMSESLAGVMASTLAWNARDV